MTERATIDFSLGCMDIQANIEFDIDPGEPMVMYYSDGSGYPGSPPEFYLTEITVTSVGTIEGESLRAEHPDWFADLDWLAENWIHENGPADLNLPDNDEF